MWKHERTQPRLLDIIGIRTGAPTLTIYCLSAFIIRSPSLSPSAPSLRIVWARDPWGLRPRPSED